MIEKKMAHSFASQFIPFSLQVSIQILQVIICKLCKSLFRYLYTSLRIDMHILQQHQLCSFDLLKSNAKLSKYIIMVTGSSNRQLLKKSENQYKFPLKPSSLDAFSRQRYLFIVIRLICMSMTIFQTYQSRYLLFNNLLKNQNRSEGGV